MPPATATTTTPTRTSESGEPLESADRAATGSASTSTITGESVVLEDVVRSGEGVVGEAVGVSVAE